MTLGWLGKFGPLQFRTENNSEEDDEKGRGVTLNSEEMRAGGRSEEQEMDMDSAVKLVGQRP